jgi:hypothetical protein
MGRIPFGYRSLTVLALVADTHIKAMTMILVTSKGPLRSMIRMKFGGWIYMMRTEAAGQ